MSVLEPQYHSLAPGVSLFMEKGQVDVAPPTVEQFELWLDGSGVDPETVPLPLVEDPDHRLRGPGDAPPPAATYPLAPGWEPRRTRGGTYDETWKRTRAPLWAKDLDERFFDVAPDCLTAAPKLRGGEPIVTENIGRAGAFSARVPRNMIRVMIDRQRFVPELDLVVVEPAVERVTATFRVSTPVDTSDVRLPPIIVQELKHRPLGGPRRAWP